MQDSSIISNVATNTSKGAVGVTLKAKVAADSAASAGALKDENKTSSSFEDALANASVVSTSTKPTFAGPAAQPKTSPSSDFVFDPLCVVGIIPESNTFLQAIRRWLDKPLSSAGAQTLATEPFAAKSNTQDLKVGDTSVVSNMMGSLNAQLNYLGTSSNQDTNAKNTKPQVSPPAQQTAFSSIPYSINKVVATGNTLSDLVDQYLAGTSSLNSEKVVSDLAVTASIEEQVTK